MDGTHAPHGRGGARWPGIALLCVCALAAGCGTESGGAGGPPGTAEALPVQQQREPGAGGDGGAGAGPGTEPERPAPSPEHSAADPVRLRVPALFLTAAVGPLDTTGREHALATPDDPSATGWWRDGPEPGEEGPAVLVGHYDSDTGPAVFHRLADLRPGDAVLIDRADGSTAAFRVRASESHAQDAFPTARVYGDTQGRAALRLITCGGTYDRAEGHYLENLIVYAELAATGAGSP
ncbi:class F sortase [Streptomyces sp. N2-109]|uniref:Class F sortase n=1 Tax=Streptomyces gossypii TaxID=2883101 RepID=A0ABT2JPS1_9ACTN|nr:class F sortase [Streptomyces gossypii]MCT2589872.1 class F sortase [Streptomyces gossypii]